MFRLLALVATTLAAPQYPYGVPSYYYPPQPGYPIGLKMLYPTVQNTWNNPMRMIYPDGRVQVQATYNPELLYPSGLYPLAQAQVEPQAPNTRGLVKFGELMEINSKFVAQTADTTAAGTTTDKQVIVGTVNVQQNLVTDFLNGNEAQYKIYVRTSRDLDLTGKNIMLGFKDSCTTAASGTEVFATVNAPPQINGFYIAGRTTGYNINGENGKATLKNMFMQILDATGTDIIGCTEAKLN